MLFRSRISREIRSDRHFGDFRRRVACGRTNHVSKGNHELLCETNPCFRKTNMCFSGIVTMHYGILTMYIPKTFPMNPITILISYGNYCKHHSGEMKTSFAATWSLRISCWMYQDVAPVSHPPCKNAKMGSGAYFS